MKSATFSRQKRGFIFKINRQHLANPAFRHKRHPHSSPSRISPSPSFMPKRA